MLCKKIFNTLGPLTKIFGYDFRVTLLGDPDESVNSFLSNDYGSRYLNVFSFTDPWWFISLGGTNDHVATPSCYTLDGYVDQIEVGLGSFRWWPSHWAINTGT